MHADKPLFWHQGLFLQPQHFQLADLHQQHKLRALRQYVQPHFWGVTRLSIRASALERRTVEIDEVEILFDDGSLVHSPGNAVLAPRMLDTALAGGDKPVMMYLGLRKWNPEGANVTLMDDGGETANTMFVASPTPEEIPDFHGTGPLAQVKPMRYVLRLFWETELENLGAYSLVPIGRLVPDGEQVRLAEDFAPPCLTMTASTGLAGLFRGVADQVAARCRRLEEYKSPSGLGSGDLDYSSTVFLLALRTLNRYAPLLRHMAEAPHVHPWQAFGLLRQLVGELSSFTRDVSALGEGRDGEKLLPDYDHQDLYRCFRAASELIARILDSLTAGPEFMTQLLYEDPYYTAEVPERAFAAGNTYWLLVRTAQPEQALAEMRKVAKLSATRGMSSLLARAVHGLNLVYQENPPPGLPRTKGALCFRIDTESPLWEAVETTRSVSLYWDSAPKDMAAFIAVRRG